MTTGMLLDLLVAGLLTATIVYAAILNRRLTALRQGKEELRAVIEDFTRASQKAEAGMAEMRTASETTGRALKDMLDDAQALRDDLSFLLERGGEIADRLEHDVRVGRVHHTAAPAGRTGEKDVSRDADGVAGRDNHGGGSGDDPIVKLRRILEATR